MLAAGIYLHLMYVLKAHAKQHLLSPHLYPPNSRICLSSLSGINAITSPASDIAALCLSSSLAALYARRLSVPIALLGLSSATIPDSCTGGSQLNRNLIGAPIFMALHHQLCAITTCQLVLELKSLIQAFYHWEMSLERTQQNLEAARSNLGILNDATADRQQKSQSN